MHPVPVSRTSRLGAPLGARGVRGQLPEEAALRVSNSCVLLSQLYTFTFQRESGSSEKFSLSCSPFSLTCQSACRSVRVGRP